MTKSLAKNTFREIKNSKARFISIMAIIALGVGFFSGIKATVPSMYNLARTYCNEQNLMDYRLVSTVGFDEDDIKAIRETDGISGVMPSYFCDVMMSADDGGDIVHLMALPKAYKDNDVMNSLVVKDGRLPQNKNEIAVENSVISGVKYKVGDTIRFDKTAGDTDVTSEINSLEYKVVGVVQSPLYISYQRGSTSIGDGKIAQYMYIPEENFAFERYTELYVKADFSDKYPAFSEEYDSNSAKIAENLQKTAEEREEAFNVEVIEKAHQDLQDAEDEYNKEKEKADTEFDNAKQELDDSEKTYQEKTSEAQSELDNAKVQIENGRTELSQSKEEYNTKIAAAEAELAQNESELEKAKEEYNASKEQFNSEISSAQAKIDSGYEEYNSAYEDFKTNSEPQLLSAIEFAQAAVDALNEAASKTTDPAQLEIINKMLVQANAALEKINITYNTALDELNNSKEQLDSAQSELNEKKALGEAELNDAESKIEQGEIAISQARSELEAAKNEGYNKLVQAESELDSAQSKYDEGVAELDSQKADGRKKLDDAQKEYNDKKSEADKKFSDAKADIESAREKTEDLKYPEWYVFDRDDNPGFSTFSQNADRLDAVASVFPVFFLLVAVLVCVTTMTRLIEEKRTEIGTFKALGYSNLSIIMKFVIYSVIAGLLGSVLGTALGVFSLPFIIYNAYKIMYYIGDITLVLDVPSIVLGIAAAMLCTTVVSVVVCMRSLSHKPAEAMRPKAPKPGKRILLERIAPLWNHMGFTVKLTARNLFRYKSRLCMTVIGVAGCTALIVAAFGLLNSFDPLTKDQYETIYKYNTVVVPKESGTESELKYLTDEMKNNSNVSEYMLAIQEEAEVEFDGNRKDDGTYLSVVQSPENMDSIISLHTRKGKKELELSDSGVLISEKLSDEMGIKKGDTIKLYSDSGTSDVKVEGIFEQYIYNYIYMSPTLYKTLYNKDVKYNMLDVKLSDCSTSAENEFSTRYLKDDRIAAVTFINTSLNDFKNMLNSLNMVVAVMIICAAALAFVVLYNLTNINIAERVREIATFKVLGFYNKETSSFIYRENIILTLIGIAVGLVLGVFLTGFIVQTVEVDNIMFGRDIYFTSYLYAAGLTFLFSLLVNAVMSFKIKSVNMVESLKSVE